MKIFVLVKEMLFGAFLLALSGCANNPLPPDWQSNAQVEMKRFSHSWLTGNTRLAEKEFAQARNEIASTGRADLVARVELVRCANRVAALVFDNCAGFQPLVAEADASERSYAAYLTGHWDALDPALLPPQHRAVAASASATAAATALRSIDDPLSRLVAAGALFQRGQLSPGDVVIASDTASNQGWRRPLLAWLGVQLQGAQQAGNAALAAQLQRRIALVSLPLE